MAEKTNKYSLDATDYFAAVNKIVSKNQELALSIQILGKHIQTNAKQLDSHTRVIENADKAPKELIAMYRLLGGQFDETGTKILFLDKRFAAHEKALDKVTTRYQQAYMRQAEIVLKAEAEKQRAIEQTQRMMTQDMLGRTGTRASGGRFNIPSNIADPSNIQTERELSEQRKISRERQRILEQQVRAVATAMATEARTVEQEERRKQRAFLQSARDFETSMLRQVQASAKANQSNLSESIRRSAGITRGTSSTGTILNTAKPKREIEEFTETMAKAESVGKKSSEGILLSWRSMARLFVIQAAHTAVREFINAIEASIATTAQWQIKISEIRTITQDQPKNFDDWAAAVRRLSDEFGNPILDVTEGVYETISNQIGKGATATNFMTKALQFAKVTGSTTADSVNLLSAAINSFGLSTVETDRVAAVFFKTIDKGRLRASDVANTFGRVGPSAHALGLSLEEVGSALATLTIKGVPPHEAMTLLNNVMKGLISPSKEMKQVFQDLGVETGEQAIQIHTFAGVLAELEKQARGSSTEIGQLFHDVRGRRGATIFSGEGLQTFQTNLQAMKDSALDYQRAIGIALESPGAQLLIQINKIKNAILTDFGAPVIKQILEISNALSDSGLAGVLSNVVSISKLALTGYIAFRAATILLNKESRIAQFITTERAAQEARLLQISQARVSQMIIELEIRELLNKAELASALGQVELFAAYQSQLTSLNKTNAAIQTGTASLIAQSTAAGRTASVLKTVGAGLVGFLTNPVFLLTAGLVGAVALYHSIGEEQERVSESFKKSYEAGAEFNEKLTNITQKELAKQGEEFTKHLNARYAAYTDFVTKIERQLEELTSREQELSKQSTEYAKESIDQYVKTFTDALSKLQSEHEKTIENIRKTEEDLDKNRASFAENEFKRALKLAEHAERMKNPGARGNPVSGEQINLTAQEINRLRGENARLLTLTGNSKTDADNAQRAQENLKKIDELLTNQAERRFSIEEGRKRLAEQIAELEAQQAARANERITQNEQADLRQQQRDERQKSSRNPRNVQFDLQDQSSSKQTELEAERRKEQDRITDKKLEELKITQQNYDASLAILPQITAIQNQGVDLQREENALLEKRRDLLKQAADQEQKEIDARKNSLVPLRVALEALQKFKLDPKLDVNDPEAVRKQFEQFNQLIQNASAAGLTDQKVLMDLARQRIDLENEITAKIAAEEAKASAVRIAANKKELETQVEQQKNATIELQQTAAESANRLFAIIGGPATDGKRVLGPIEESKWVLPDPNDLTDFTDPEKLVVDALAEMRRLTIEITKEQSKAVETKTLFNPAHIEELKKKYRELQAIISEAYTHSLLGGTQFTQPIGPNRTNAAGQNIGKITLGEILTQGAQAIAAIAASGEEINKAIAKQLEDRAALEAIKEKERGLPDLAPKILAQAKSFDDLNKETQLLLESMQKLNKWLEQQRSNPNPSGVPIAVPKMAFGGMMGTDSLFAALTPGEFIVNKSATQKFLPQLMAMNRYADGGIVGWNPNFIRPSYDIPLPGTGMLGGVTIGQITLQSVSPAYDARQLGREIEREVRLGRLSSQTGSDD